MLISPFHKGAPNPRVTLCKVTAGARWRQSSYRGCCHSVHVLVSVNIYVPKMTPPGRQHHWAAPSSCWWRLRCPHLGRRRGAGGNMPPAVLWATGPPNTCVVSAPQRRPSELWAGSTHCSKNEGHLGVRQGRRRSPSPGRVPGAPRGHAARLWAQSPRRTCSRSSFGMRGPSCERKHLH